MKTVFLCALGLALAGAPAIAGDQPVMVYEIQPLEPGVIHYTVTDTGETIIEGVAGVSGQFGSGSGAVSGPGGSGVLPAGAIDVAMTGSEQDALYAKLLAEAKARGLR